MIDNEEILDTFPKEEKLLTTPASRVGTFISIASFIIGSILFLYYVVVPDEVFLPTGLIFVLTAFGINFLNFLYLLIIPGTNEEKKVNRRTAVKMLINIPIVIIYFIIIINIPLSH